MKSIVKLMLNSITASVLLIHGKIRLKAGSGLMGDHFTADIRLSNITSDGYIDRASSRLRSLYFSAAYIDKTNTLRFNII